MTQGGKRTGAGRKSKWNCETVTLRVPKSLVAEIQAFIEQRMGKAQTASENPSTPEPLVLWRGDPRCQAATSKGARCKLPTSVVYVVCQTGRSIEIGLCQRHRDQIRQGIEPRVHPSVFDSVTK
jgi:hypothetical protein